MVTWLNGYMVKWLVGSGIKGAGLNWNLVLMNYQDQNI
jgi:hypothetical protein